MGREMSLGVARDALAARGGVPALSCPLAPVCLPLLCCLICGACFAVRCHCVTAGWGATEVYWMLRLGAV